MEAHQVVLLIHGIRTHAAWQQRLRQYIENDIRAGQQIRVYGVRYGRMGGFRFWSPGPLREREVKKVIRAIDEVKLKYPHSKISVIAHSFGTYAIARILETEFRIQIDKLILCGSIVRSDFPWVQFSNRVGEVINDIGTRDFWPPLAKASTWGYGASGQFGFEGGGAFVWDRYHNYTHSDFFTEEFVKTFWVPFIVEGKKVPSRWDLERPNPPWWVTFISELPLRWVIVILLIGSSFFIVKGAKGINTGVAQPTRSETQSIPEEIGPGCIAIDGMGQRVYASTSSSHTLPTIVTCKSGFVCGEPGRSCGRPSAKSKCATTYIESTGECFCTCEN
jgi:hypothetical protein